jgi:hypothetical protein
MARRRFKSWGRKRKSNPKATKVYKDGMKKQAVIFGALGVLSVAIFYKTAVFQKVIEMTPTFEG